MDLTQFEPKLLKAHLGAAGAETFLAFHQAAPIA